MAGGKETPRQKLISLMYLVLMAMLAMNVSAAVLDKFFYLDKSLKHAVDQEHISSGKLISSMADKVIERKNKPKEVKALDMARKVREGSSNLSKKIEEIRIKLAGELDEKTGKPKQMKNTDITATVMIGVKEGKNDGLGYKLEEAMDEYVNLLNTIYTDTAFTAKGKKVNEPLTTLTPSAKEDPELKNDDHQIGKDWVNVNFEGSPVIAALATLSEKESKIVEYEQKVLRHLAKMVGADDISFDKIVGMSRLKSSIVAAGTEIEGEIFVTAFSTSMTPTMKLDGRVLPIEDGMGKFKNKVSAKNYDENGFAKKVYKAEIILDDKVLKFDVDYVVSKPVIEIKSKSVSSLYKDCANILEVNVPALGSFYNPTFTLGSSSEGVVKKGSSSNTVMIIPKKPTVNLNVKNDGLDIGSEPLQVRLVPKPTIEVHYKGRPVDQKRGVEGSPRSLTIKVIPEPEFKKSLPKDANYLVTEWEAILVRGKRPVDKRTLSSATGTINFSSARAGDRILVEVKGVARKKVLGGTDPVITEKNPVLFNIPLN